MAIKFVIDSASDLTLREAQTLSVRLLPIPVTFGEESYRDGIDLTHQDFFEKLTAGDVFPQTSQINLFAFEECFRELTADGSEVLAITLSSKLSGTYENALRAAEPYGGKVAVVDSLNATVGERLLLLRALRLLPQVSSVRELAVQLDEEKHRIRLMALLGTLEYLQKGGRISAVTAFSGTLLHIKPVVCVEDGNVRLLGKAMGAKKGAELLTRLIEEAGGIDFSMPYGGAYSDPDDRLLQSYLQNSAALWKEGVENVPASSIGSSIGAHVGPGAIAVAFFAK